MVSNTFNRPIQSETLNMMRIIAVAVVALMVVSVRADEDEGVPACQYEWNKAESIIQDYYEQTGLHIAGHHKPSCLEDGTYAAKQCRGSVCNCVAADGTILTKDFSIGEALVSSCICARDKHEYEQKNLLGLEHKCTTTGSYKPVQCTGSVCYCVDMNGKQQGSHTVNRALADTLECSL